MLSMVNQSQNWSFPPILSLLPCCPHTAIKDTHWLMTLSGSLLPGRKGTQAQKISIMLVEGTGEDTEGGGKPGRRWQLC